jgi:ArsR family transcriptional regulator, arsenate/arsenite/antimonite-responsive transcriptional repressor
MSTRARPGECCIPIRAHEPLPEQKRDRLVAMLRALGDPTRLEIFRLIAAQAGPMCVCDVVDGFSLSQPTISHHLKALREAGLVTVSRRGVWAYYSANPRGPAELQNALAELAPADLEAVG